MFKKEKPFLMALLISLIFTPTNKILAAYLGNYGHNITVTGIVYNLENLIWIIFTFIVVFCFVIAGIMFLTALGDPAKLKTARAAFLWGIAGVIVGILAYSIISITVSWFG